MLTDVVADVVANMSTDDDDGAETDALVGLSTTEEAYNANLLKQFTAYAATCVRDAAVNLLTSFAVTNIQWRGNNFKDHFKKMFLTIPNRKNFITAFNRLMQAGTDRSGYNNTKVVASIELDFVCWPAFIDDAKPFEDNVRICRDFMEIAYLRQYKNVISISQITENDAFRSVKPTKKVLRITAGGEPKRASTRKRRRIATKGTLDDENTSDNVSDLDGSVPPSLRISTPSIADVEFLLACDVLFEVAALYIASSREVIDIDAVVIFQKVWPHKKIEDYTQADALACAMVSVNFYLVTIAVQFLRDQNSSWRLSCSTVMGNFRSAYFKLASSSSVSRNIANASVRAKVYSVVKPNDAEDVRSTCKHLFRSLATSWRSLSSSDSLIGLDYTMVAELLFCGQCA
ncbi:hypothetical protein BC829DRAFT_449166 [Chytridium lagenaria]|nr:hypothetical protein BC829DRAFT_449166 [Chytridium lagenaria]